MREEFDDWPDTECFVLAKLHNSSPFDDVAALM